jgi:ribose 5-phosphate isomerase B
MVASGEVDRGVLICGTGVGISLAANKVKGIRAAACSDTATARLIREHNNANVIAIGARIVGSELAKDIVKTFLTTDFSEGERHCRRLALISELEEKFGK